MPHEVKDERDSAAYDDRGGEQVPQQRNSPEKDQHRTESENHAADVIVGRDLRHVNFRAGRIAIHEKWEISCHNAITNRRSCYHRSNVPTDLPQAARSRAGRIAILCAYLAAGVAVLGGAESLAQALFNKVRSNVLENVRRFPHYTCIQTVTRKRFDLPQTGSSCASVIARNNSGSGGRILRWHDRLRLDVAVGEKSEMFSWAGASQFESGDMSEVVSRGATGSGEFGSFLMSVFGGEAEGFLYRGLRDMPYGRVSSFDYTVPLAKSHYQYTTGKGYTTAAYHGSFFVDPDTADLKELDIEADSFPGEEELCRVQDKIQYARTQIGQNSYALASNSSMDAIYRHGTESLNETVFSGCREYVGESTIRFDVDENGNTPESAKRAELKPLPVKTRLRVKISPPIDSATAAAGDPITGVIESAVKQKGVTLVNAGDKLRGRILRLEQTVIPTPRWTVAILFETISRSGIEEKISLKPLDDGDRAPDVPQSMGRRGGAPAAVASNVTTERPAGGGIYTFSEPGNLVLGPKFESDWETR